MAFPSPRLALASAVVLLMATSSSAAAAQPSWTFRHDKPPALENSRTFVVQGKHILDGCVFQSPELSVPDDEVAITQRELAVDLPRCLELLEEGIPGDDQLAAEDRWRTMPDFEVVGTSQAAISEPDSNSQDIATTTATQTYWKTGYALAYWTDIAGGAVAMSETDIKWHWGNGCAFAGYGANTLFGYHPTGWYPVQWPWWEEISSCGYYKGIGNDAKVRNDSFCPFQSVSITFDYTTAQGSSSGVLSGSRYTYRSSSCLPLSPQWTVRVTGSGRDPIQ